MSKISVKIPKDGWTAWSYVLFGVIFLVKSPMGLPLHTLFGVNAWGHVSHFLETKVTVEDAKPVMSLPDSIKHSQSFSIFPEAYAQSKSRSMTIESENAIRIKGQFYGFYDPDFELFKIEKENRILLHYKPTGKVLMVEVEIFDKIQKGNK